MWQAGFAAIPSYPTIQNPVRIRHVVHQSYVQQIALTCNFTNIYKSYQPTGPLFLSMQPTTSSPPPFSIRKNRLGIPTFNCQEWETKVWAGPGICLEGEETFVEETPCLPARLMHHVFFNHRKQQLVGFEEMKIWCFFFIFFLHWKRVDTCCWNIKCVSCFLA